jgi:L-alanine-DL-glutamate epimerase-like enolase superfamily enzyme
MKFSRRDFLASTAAGLAVTPFCRAADEAGDRQAERTGWNAELGRHRIAAVELAAVQMKWPRQVGKNARLDIHGFGPKVPVCRLRTDRGVVGWGAVRGPNQAVERLQERVQGRAVSDLFDPASGITRDELAPLDFALHDLAGMILDLPVYKLLGGHGPITAPCYSGMIYFDDLEPPGKPAGIAKVIQNCRDDYDLGYRQLKVKIGRGNKWMPKAEGIRRDIEVTRAIAERFPDVEILVDGNDGFTADELIEYLEGIGDVKLFWIEEPFRENVADYAKIREWHERHDRKTLLADGEADPDWKVLGALTEEKLLDVQLVDIVGHGFTAWRKLMPELKRQQVLASPHAWGSLLKTYYVSHLTAGLGNVVTIEGVTCTSDDVDFGDYRLKDGRLTVSDAPGFGMKLR